MFRLAVVAFRVKPSGRNFWTNRFVKHNVERIQLDGLQNPQNLLGHITRMERIIQSHGEHLKPVLLYRDDIEQIVEVMREVSPDAELSTDQHKFNDIKEWAELKRDYFTNMRLKTTNPYVSLELSERSVWLYIDKDTAQSRGAFEKIKRLLTKLKRPSEKLMNYWMPPIIVNLCIYFLLAASLSKKLSLNIWTITIVDVILLLAGWWWTRWVFQSRTRKYSIIIPKYRIDAPNFWQRNSDKIVLAIICTVLGSLLTLLIKSLTAQGP